MLINDSFPMLDLLLSVLPVPLAASLSGAEIMNFFWVFVVLAFSLLGFFCLERYLIAPWMWPSKGRVIAAQLITLVILTVFLFGLEYWFISTYELSSALMLLCLVSGITVKMLAYILYALKQYEQYRQEYPKILTKQKLTSAHERAINQRLEHFKDTFSPHLMFNVLNDVQNQLPQDSTAYKTIDILYQVLYYEFNTPADREVPLSQELTHVNNYLSLHLIKDPDLCIHFYKKGDFSQVKILPRILINYIDNAIKHGVRNDQERPIIIRINANEDAFSLEVSNYKNNHTMPGTRYGNTITATALRTFYDTRQELFTNSFQDTYQVNLKILREPPSAATAPQPDHSTSDLS